MKLITILFFLVLSSFANAVVSSHSGSYAITANSEKMVVDLAQKMLPDIMNMRIKKIIKDGRAHRCFFKENSINSKYHFSVDGIRVSKYYKINNSKDVVAYYRALIDYTFKQCSNNLGENKKR